MKHRHPGRPLAPLLILATLALAGCGGGGSPAPASSDKTLTSFAIDKPAMSGTIDPVNKTITFDLPFNDMGWLSSEVATFTSTGASVKINGTVATSGVSTANFFASDATVVVTAQDGSTTTYYLVPNFHLISWGWMKGSNLTGQAGTYGSPGSAATANTPGARWGAASWRDGSGRLWLFGGHSRDGAGNDIWLNDLWMFDGSNWTWKGGANTPDQPGSYGTQGVAAPGNFPGAREGAATWQDSGGNVWLFGGNGFGKDGGSIARELNDLWKFDGTQWTWVGGPDTFNGSPWGLYGTQGSYDAANLPGPRRNAVAWRDGNDHLWLFGGAGNGEYDAVTPNTGLLNDLWEFNGTQWRWVGGSKQIKASGSYGTQGSASAGNAPGAREGGTGWVGADGSLWLFGGEGYADAAFVNAYGELNDLWKFDGTQWTWVSGLQTANSGGTYQDPDHNMPGGRYGATGWVDAGGSLWLFGGTGYDLQTRSGHLNDVWKYDGSKWNWQGGSLIAAEYSSDYPGYYQTQMGTQGTSSTANLPSGRSYANAWFDPASGHVWLFGGVEIGYYAPGAERNDLWEATP